MFLKNQCLDFDGSLFFFEGFREAILTSNKGQAIFAQFYSFSFYKSSMVKWAFQEL